MLWTKVVLLLYRSWSRSRVMLPIFHVIKRDSIRSYHTSTLHANSSATSIVLPLKTRYQLLSYQLNDILMSLYHGSSNVTNSTKNALHEKYLYINSSAFCYKTNYDSYNHGLQKRCPSHYYSSHWRNTVTSVWTRLHWHSTDHIHLLNFVPLY